VSRARQVGFEICIISNTNQHERLAKIASSIGAITVRGRFKPSRSMFRLALIKFGRKPEEAIMVGDQLITDVLGANRTGIEAIWVRRLEGKEFKGTSINRVMERMLTGPIYQALVTPIDETRDAPAIERAKPFAQKTLVHQIVKFGIVGGSSFVIDFGLTYIFMKVIPSGDGLMSNRLGAYLISSFPAIFHYAKNPGAAALPILGTVASFFAMTNSAFMNRAWTFEVKGKTERAKQIRRFYVVSTIGLCISTVVATAAYNVLGNQQLLVAKVIGAGVGAVWNFIGSRTYAFRGHV
jgi:HAD superfamily phosphatase (TIGR01668 family)